MSDAPRPFPPSARRAALARSAGLTWASPIVVAAAAWLGALVALVAVGRASAARLGAWIAAACASADAPSVTAATDASPSGAIGAGHLGASPAVLAVAPLGGTPATPQLDVAGHHAVLAVGNLGATQLDAAGHHAVLAVGDVGGAVISLALPIVAAAAIAAIVAHLVQTRSPWLPRRRLDGAPAIDPHRARDGAIDLARAVVIGGVAVGWLWWAAPRLAVVMHLGAGAEVGAACWSLATSALAAIAIAFVGLGALDALIRAADVGRALSMTAQDKKEDDRLAAPDPRWRRLRERAAAEPRGTSIVVAGLAVAVAIAWDPVRTPTPRRLAAGTDLRATQLLARARHARTPIVYDDDLARSLARSRTIAEAHWPRLAEIIATRS